MKRSSLTAVLLSAVLGMAVLAADPPALPPAAPPPAAAVVTKGRLPARWKLLGLSDGQRQKAFAVTSTAKTKLAKLEAEIAAVKADEHKQLNAILTDEQRTHLAELLTGAPTTPKP